MSKSFQIPIWHCLSSLSTDRLSSLSVDHRIYYKFFPRFYLVLNCLLVSGNFIVPNGKTICSMSIHRNKTNKQTKKARENSPNFIINKVQCAVLMAAIIIAAGTKDTLRLLGFTAGTLLPTTRGKQLKITKEWFPTYMESFHYFT